MRAKTGLIAAIFISIAMPFSARADGLLAIESTEVPAEGRGAVTVSMKDAAKTGALDMEISFGPDDMEFDRVENGPVADNAQVQANEVSPGRVKIALMDMDGFSGDGAILSLHFNIKAAKGKTIPIRIESAQANHCEALVEIPIRTQDGQLTVVSGKINLSSETLMMIAAAAGGVVFLIILIVMIARKKGRDSGKGQAQ